MLPAKELKYLQKIWLKPVFIFILIVLFSLYLRLINLTILPVFADEAIYIRWAQVMNAEPTLRFLPLSDGKQPLYMWILMFIVNRFNDPLFAGRLVSAVASLGTLSGIFVLSAILFKNPKVSLASSLLYVLSPFAFFFDRMALVDSLLAMFAVWSLILAVLTVMYKRLDTALLMGFTLGGAALTKSPALFIAIILLSTFILHSWDFKNIFSKKNIYSLLMLLGLFAVSYLIAFGFYNILRLGPNYHLLTQRTRDYVYPLSHILDSPFDPLKPFLHRAYTWVWIMGPSTILAFVLISFSNCKKYWRELFILWVWLLFPIIVQAEFAKTFTARYIYYAVIAIYLIAGVAFIEYKNSKRKISLFLGLLIFSFQALTFNYLLITDPAAAPLPRGERNGYLEEWTAGTGLTDIAQFLEEESAQNPNQQIVVGTEGYFGTTPDGLQIYTQDISNVVVFGVGVEFGEVPQQLIDSVQSGNKTYFVVNSSRLHIPADEWEESGLNLIKQFKKADREEGSVEFVQKGKFDYLYLFEVKL